VVVDEPLNIQPGDVRCPRCLGKDLVPSLPRGIWDSIMKEMGKVPRHCRSCGKRFYLRPEAPPVKAEEETS
jgi:hypothetical protein